MYPGEWRVEWFDDDGSCAVSIFGGPHARQRTLRYADRQYGLFEEVHFDSQSPRGVSGGYGRQLPK
jgi:hypothetical protein